MGRWVFMGQSLAQSPWASANLKFFLNGGSAASESQSFLLFMLLNSSIRRLIASKRGGVKIKDSNGQPHYNAQNRPTWWRKGPNIIFGYIWIWLDNLWSWFHHLETLHWSSLQLLKKDKKGMAGKDRKEPGAWVPAEVGRACCQWLNWSKRFRHSTFFAASAAFPKGRKYWVWTQRIPNYAKARLKSWSIINSWLLCCRNQPASWAPAYRSYSDVSCLLRHVSPLCPDCAPPVEPRTAAASSGLVLALPWGVPRGPRTAKQVPGGCNLQLRWVVGPPVGPWVAVPWPRGPVVSVAPWRGRCWRCPHPPCPADASAWPQGCWGRTPKSALSDPGIWRN